MPLLLTTSPHSSSRKQFRYFLIFICLVTILIPTLVFNFNRLPTTTTTRTTSIHHHGGDSITINRLNFHVDDVDDENEPLVMLGGGAGAIIVNNKNDIHNNNNHNNDDDDHVNNNMNEHEEEEDHVVVQQQQHDNAIEDVVVDGGGGGGGDDHHHHPMENNQHHNDGDNHEHQKNIINNQNNQNNDENDENDAEEDQNENHNEEMDDQKEDNDNNNEDNNNNNDDDVVVNVNNDKNNNENNDNNNVVRRNELEGEGEEEEGEIEDERDDERAREKQSDRNVEQKEEVKKKKKNIVVVNEQRPYTDTLRQKLDMISNNGTREVIITTATSGFSSLLLNWMCTLKQLDLLPQVLIFVMDDAPFMHELMRVYGIPEHQIVSLSETIPVDDGDGENDKNHSKDEDDGEDEASRMLLKMYGSSLSSTVQYRSLEYQVLMVLRTRFIRRVLHMNYTILLADNDAIWLRDPFRYIRDNYDDGSNGKNQKVPFDFLAQNDRDRTMKDRICGGFIYMRPTSAMREMWDRVTERHTRLVIGEQKYRTTEQDLLNDLWQSGKARAVGRLLPMHVFPPGYYTFKLLVQRHSATFDAFRTVHVIHNNWIVGSPKKIERFKQYGMWYLGPNDGLSAGTVSQQTPYRFMCIFPHGTTRTAISVARPNASTPNIVVR